MHAIGKHVLVTAANHAGTQQRRLRPDAGAARVVLLVGPYLPGLACMSVVRLRVSIGMTLIPALLSVFCSNEL